MRPSSRLALLTIAILVVLILQQRSPFLPPTALALRGLNDSAQMHNGSLPIASNSTAYNLPDPSDCEPPQTTHLATFFSAKSGREQHNHGADAAVERPSLASNSSTAENSTHTPASPSVHVMDLDEAQDVLWINKPQQLAGSTPPPSDTTIHTAAQSSVARESVEVMEIAEDGVLISISSERLAGSTPPPSDTTIHAAAQSSVARESVQVMEVAEVDALMSVSSERLGRATPPPIDKSIHTASQRSAARESMQQAVFDISEDGINNEEQILGASTPPPSDLDIHTASQSSIATRDSNLPDESQLFNTLR